MKKARKFFIMLALALMLGLMAGVTVSAGTVVPIGPPEVVGTLEKLGSTSTVYAGRIFVDLKPEMIYLYSEDITNSRVIFDNLSRCLRGTAFDGLVPTLSEDSEAKGLAVSSAHQEEMSPTWTSAADVAGQYFTGTVGTETSGNLYGLHAAYQDNVKANYAERRETYDTPLDFNESIGSILKVDTRRSDVMKDGRLITEVVITATIEETTVIYTAVNVTTDKSEGIGGKTQWMFGDTIDFNSTSSSYQTYYQKVGIDPSFTTPINNGSYTVVYESWNAKATQHNIIFKHNNGGNYLHFKPDDFEAESPETPIGIKLVSGEGTKASPYLFELVYDEPDDPEPISATVTFKVVNGSWDDGNSEDKTVTLTGYEGDTLKLAAADIPAVGSKPDDGYKAGSWNAAPGTETAITANTTYTYSYAQKENISATVTFKVEGGSWDDGSAADKTVTLTGYEGDTLKLASADIPAVGSKPGEGYKAGSWNVTPDTEKAITADTTYTYSYAEDKQEEYQPYIPELISATVTFKVEGGSWDDGSAADKTVTLIGYEGDTLKLAAADIPAVGSKPDDGYKAGSWNAAPGTETAITANTTYTYSYAQKENISATVTFKVEGGSWDDGTTADKTVTLTGYEGDTLKLAAADIPAVGSRPNDGYKAGSWNAAPGTETSIAADTTYTYSYAEDKEPEDKEPEDKEPEDKEPEDDEISYINTEGTGETWTKESSTGLTFRFSRSVDDKETFSHFTGVLVDGKEVDPSNYTAKAGSVIIDLKPAYMETLSAGEHTLTALFDDGNDVAVKFTVKAKKAEEKPAKDKSGDNTKKGGDSGKKAAPKTGESFNLPIMLAILLLAFSGIISLGIIGLKTKGKKGEPKE